MKNPSSKSLLLTAAMAGLLSTGVPAFASAHTSTTQNTTSQSTSSARLLLAHQDDQKSDTHSCKGKNDCKGKGGCKSSDNGCKGKNDCKGKGGCATDGSQPPHAA
jgi:hypothetical protein